jgi:hypothetical protein
MAGERHGRGMGTACYVWIRLKGHNIHRVGVTQTTPSLCHSGAQHSPVGVTQTTPSLCLPLRGTTFTGRCHTDHAVVMPLRGTTFTGRCHTDHAVYVAAFLPVLTRALTVARVMHVLSFRDALSSTATDGFHVQGTSNIRITLTQRRVRVTTVTVKEQ